MGFTASLNKGHNFRPTRVLRRNTTYKTSGERGDRLRCKSYTDEYV